MLPHHGTRGKTPSAIEDDFGPGQQLGHDVSIRPMHIATDGLDGGSVPGVDPLCEQRAYSLVFKGPAVNAPVPCAQPGVQAEARRGRAERGPWTPASTGLTSPPPGRRLTVRRPCIHFGERPDLRVQDFACETGWRRTVRSLFLPRNRWCVSGLSVVTFRRTGSCVRVC